ncbi:MAG: MSHA biogenesis protein MshK [Bermanella sp.]|jgi:MSHA biogenesis protein MshK
MLINKSSRFCGGIALLITLLIAQFSVATRVHAETLSDPMRPPGKSERLLNPAESKVDTSINVTAVFKKNQTFYAVINNNWLERGQKVGAWRVTEITNSGVFLKNENEPEAMPLRFLVNEKSDFKKQTNNE